jgi:two-component system, sensor histidine kinase and response regulator
MPTPPQASPFAADILVVDDAPANLQLLFGMLKDRKYRVRPVASGRTALQAAKAQPPDIVLLDVNMPEMNGYEVCKALKQDETLRSVPVIFISALTEPFDKLQAFSAGGVDYITKPFHLDEVRVRIETHLALRQLRGTLEEQNRDLAAANERLRALEETRNVLQSAIVHDLKSPLAALLSSAEYLLSSDAVEGEVREVLEEMLWSSHGVHRIILNMLDITRTEDVELTARRRLVLLGEIVQRAQTAACLTMRMTGHRLTVENDAEQEVEVDPDLVTRVIENLLDNSLKYSPRGSEVRLRARADEGRGCTLELSDNGRGIPPDQRERIFERYARLDRELEVHSRTSRGLGLAFCKMAVHAHGGEIWVEDNVPRGALFRARIPGPA